MGRLEPVEGNARRQSLPPGRRPTQFSLDGLRAENERRGTVFGMSDNREPWSPLADVVPPSRRPSLSQSMPSAAMMMKAGSRRGSQLAYPPMGPRLEPVEGNARRQS